MSDLFLELGRNPRARKLIQTLGLPLPMPQALRRAKEPWPERPLQDTDIVVGATAGAPLLTTLARTLVLAGANPFVAEPTNIDAFTGIGEAYGRPPQALDPKSSELKPRALVFDASGIRTPADLKALHGFFSPQIRRLARCGRVVVLGRPPADGADAGAAACQAALEGFVRSVGREVGRKGATANVVYVQKGAEARLEPVLRWLLSERSAFVSGQPLTVTNEVADAPNTPTIRVLDGKVVLVTGAARGIGKATAKLLANEGAHVICLDRPNDGSLCSEVARSIGGSVLLVDISAEDAAQTIVEHIQAQHHGNLDVVVHNAGITRDKTLARMKPEKWDQVLDINLEAVLKVNQALLDAGVLGEHGRVICLSSIAGIAGNMGQTNYAASKAGIIGFVHQQAQALAARGVTVNAIAPGFIETRLTAAIPVVIREAGRRLSNLGQGGLPQDIGEAITFLASPGSVGVTGQVLRVCGGGYIGA